MQSSILQKELHLQSDASHISFSIRDEGIGIPIEDQSQLFRSFSRASNVGDIQGSGLGLAIVKTCAELHGGEVSVFSELGQGATFTVTLPREFSRSQG
jgi:signal transduction histidine kinase